MMLTMRAIFVWTFVLFSAPPAFSEEEKKSEAPVDAQAYATPGEAHAIFKPLVGQWKFTITWGPEMAGKMKPATGTSTFKLLFGGRYLEQEMAGKMKGEAFQARGLIGHNNLKKRYDSIWIDSKSTGLIHGEGSYDPETKVLKDLGDYSDPAMSKKKRLYRAEWKFVDAKQMTYTMWTTGEDGKEALAMEVVYRRAN
jgi:hypothetical protein